MAPTARHPLYDLNQLVAFIFGLVAKVYPDLIAAVGPLVGVRGTFGNCGRIIPNAGHGKHPFPCPRPLAELEATKMSAERELGTLTNRRESIERLERDKNALLESLIAMTPEALDRLAPEERHRIYRMMKLSATALLDSGIEINGNIAPANEVGTLEIAS